MNEMASKRVGIIYSLFWKILDFLQIKKYSETKGAFSLTKQTARDIN